MEIKRVYKNIMMKSSKIMSKNNKKDLLEESQQQQNNSFRILRHFMRMKSVTQEYHRLKNQKLYKHSKISKSHYQLINNKECHKKYKNANKLLVKRDTINCIKG